ncbi:MAG: M15 family metallopeptidase [Phreatobacter sp.]|nr:M15 family metallopeptidase [Phreatobacter sp.]
MWVPAAFAAVFCSIAASAQPLPQGFVHLADVAPTIRQDIRYAGSRNFMGRPAAGYHAAECVLTRRAADALARAQAEIAPRGLTLVVWDCYRPQRAVADFMTWTRDETDQRMRAIYYPRVDKRDLSVRGYLSSRSTHSRGSTVDLGMARSGTPSAGGTGDCAAPYGTRIDDGVLDFGTAYDCFDTLSHVRAPGIGRDAAANRTLLAGLMQRHGFRAYAKEWWHFQLRDEPLPGQSFDFPIPPRGSR